MKRPMVWHPLEFDARDAQVHVRGRDLRAFPSSSDVPYAFAVEVDIKYVLRLRFRYSDGTDENVRLASSDHGVTIFTGESSRRLFRIEIDLKPMLAEHVKPQLVAEQLKSALRRLSERQTRVGPLLGYQVAERGLDMEGQPPPWIIEALGQLRGESKR